MVLLGIQRCHLAKIIMPRANRFFMPGGVWHVTHRCHNRKFLLKFERDRLRWRHWLFQSRKRFGLSVLTYIATSNHIHLLVQGAETGCIPASMQLISSRVAQEYNQRKSRKGAFWEGRYFATAVATDHHFIQCLTYIDLNMVRAGMVSHPEQWRVSGYREIQSPPDRYCIIDFDALQTLTGISDREMLVQAHREWIQSELIKSNMVRQPLWTESIAIGSPEFVQQTGSRLGGKVRYRTASQVSDGTLAIKEVGS